MPSFTTQPTTQTSAYRPIRFVAVSDSTSDVIEKILVEVYDDNNTLKASFRKDWTSRSGSDPYVYTFDFSIQSIVQSLLDPQPDAISGVFASPDVQFQYANGASGGFYVKVYFEERNTNNLLVQDPTPLTSETFYAFNIIQQHDEEQGLADYIAAGARRLLTEAPQYVEIREDDLFTIAAITNQNFARLVCTATYNDGTTATGFVTMSPPSGAANHNKKIWAVAVGPRTLNASPWGGTPITIDSTVKSYTVFLADGSSNPLSESITFSVVEDCPNQLRVHWLNYRGGADAYTVDGRLKKEVSVRSLSGQKPLVWASGADPHDRQQRGQYRQNVKSNLSWAVETKVLYDDMAEWLVSLLESPEVYVEQPLADYYLPARIEDARLIYTDSEEVGAILKMTVTAANERIVQRN